MIFALALSLSLAQTDATPPLKLHWIPLAGPMAVLAPGTGQLVRGERALGGRMLIASGVSLATILAAGTALYASGANDVITVITVPLITMALGTYLGMGLSDAIGTFSELSPTPLHPGFDRDVWTARVRAGAFTRASFFPRVPGKPLTPLIGAHAGLVFNRFTVDAEGGSTVQGEAMAQIGAGVKLWGFSAGTPRAGLWLDTSLRQDWAETLGFEALRLRVELAAYVPMGVFDSRFSRVFFKLRFGADPTWILSTTKRDFEVPIAAGMEFRIALIDQLRLFFGYDHSRSDQWGGQAVGFLGSFYGGLEGSLPAGIVLSARYVQATAGGIEAGVDWRW